ncbi:MAG: mechanosensitive ion channel domain-containing protein [Saprospiraceae bacterium]
MELIKLKIVETVIAIVIFTVVRFILNKSIERTVKENLLQKTRGKIAKKVTNIVLILFLVIFLLFIWGVNQSDVIVFMSSILAVIGVALFAQWSILSNITSGLILFFNHSIKLDDTIRVLDKDYEIEGRVSDIGVFFVILKTKEGEQITLPSNIFMQKMIKKKNEE